MKRKSLNLMPTEAVITPAPVEYVPVLRPSEPHLPDRSVSAPALNFHDWCDQIDGWAAHLGSPIRLTRRDPDTYRRFHQGWTPRQVVESCDWTIS